jgi:hypothetical protein
VSFHSSYDGGSLCGDHDRIVGGDGTDTATVSIEDSVSTVENLTRATTVTTTMTATSPVATEVRAGKSATFSGILEVPQGTDTRSLLLRFLPDEMARRSHFLYFDSGPANNGLFPFSQLQRVDESGTWTVDYAGRDGTGPDWTGIYEAGSSVSYHVAVESWIKGWPKSRTAKESGTEMRKTVTVAPAYNRMVVLQRKNCADCHWRNTFGRASPKGATAEVTIDWKVPKGATWWRVLLPETKAGTRAVTDAWRIKGR